MQSHGVTLPELLVCVLVLSVAAQASLGPIRNYRDAIVLRGAREEIVALFHRARMDARLSGEARLLFEEGADPALVLPDSVFVAGVALASRGVDLEVGGARSSIDLVFGPAGVAYLASATLVLRKGEAETSLVVSGYGRVRR